MLAGELGVLLSSVVVRRDALMKVGLFSPLLRVQQDLDLFLRLAHAQLGPSAFVDSVEVDYRLHATNASRDYVSALDELLLLYRSHGRAARASGDLRAMEAIEKGKRRVRSTYSYQALDAARAAAHERRAAAAAVALSRALRWSPSAFGRSAVTWMQTRRHRRREGPHTSV
jgi:hypothetical protein